MSRAYGLTGKHGKHGKPESTEGWKVRTEITGLGRSSWNELGIRKGIPEIGIRTDFARLVGNLIPTPIYIVYIPTYSLFLSLV